MNYYLYKLKFDTAVHFGASDSALSLYTSEDHFCADTLFSALCHTALSLSGQKGLDELCAYAENGKLLLSDAMPWKGERFYLPKPCVSSQGKREVSASQRKAVKKLNWIPVEQFVRFSESVHGGEMFDVESVKTDFGVSGEMAKVQIVPENDALPYQVGLFRFADDAGLWFIAGCASEEQREKLNKLIDSLGISGIGGKISSGYGKFSVEKVIYLNKPFDGVTEWLCDALTNESHKRYLLLSASLPNDNELEKLLPTAEYRLIRRSGFVQSEDYSPESRKKIPQIFLAAGSVLENKFSPVLYEVGQTGQHPVYRFSAPVFLGVSL